MRILVPAAAIAAAAAAILPVVPASAAHCSCRTVHRASYGVRHHAAVRRIAYVRPVVRRVVYRPRIVEVVRPVYRPVVYRPLYRPVRRVFVEPVWHPRPVFYRPAFYPGRFHHARLIARPWHRFDGDRGYRHDGERRFGYGGGFHRGGYGWR
jgi:hypothetical protein